MPIDTHVRIAAWLHIALGAFWVCILAILGLFIGGMGAFIGASARGADAGVLAWIASFGLVVFLFIAAFPVLEIIGGVMLLGGSTAGRVITIVFSVLELINIPFGTAIGVYSLWALLRELPTTVPVTTVPPGMPQRY
ncbi:MAG: hypothetical protein ACJ8GJ_19990 [Vitreoscilla sp.]